MKHQFFKVLIIFLFSSTSVSADVFGGDIAVLSKMFLEMKEQLVVLRDQLDALKTQSQSLKNTVNTLNEIKKEKEFWEKFDIDNQVEGVIDHYRDGTLLDELALAKDPYARYELAGSIILRRTKDRVVDPEDIDFGDFDKNSETAIDDYIDDIARADLYRDKSKDLLTGDLSNKDIDRANASANSILAAEALEQSAIRKKDEIRKRERVLEMLAEEKSFMSYLKGDK